MQKFTSDFRIIEILFQFDAISKHDTVAKVVKWEYV